MRPRNQVDGPKTNFEFDGALRLERARNAERIARFRPSGPTVRAVKRKADSEVRNSRSGEITGYGRAISRNASSPRSRAPEARRGQGRLWQVKYAAKRSALKVLPSKTP